MMEHVEVLEVKTEPITDHEEFQYYELINDIKIEPTLLEEAAEDNKVLFDEELQFDVSASPKSLKNFKKDLGIVSQDDDGRSFKCNDCKKAYRTKNMLIGHIKMQHNNLIACKTYKCGHCDYRSCQKQNVNRHVMTRHEAKSNKKIGPLYKCTMCRYSSYIKNNLMGHYRYTHQIGDNITFNKCEVCDYKTIKMSNLRRHLITHGISIDIDTSTSTSTSTSLKKKTKKYKCSLCECEVYTKSYFDKHMSLCHGNQSTIYKCHLCDKYQTNNKFNVNSHIRKVHRNKKSYKCGLCDFETFSSRPYKLHVKTVHERLPTFDCAVCRYKTYCKQALVSHIKRCAKREKNKILKCDLCEFQCCRPSGLVTHVKYMHSKGENLQKLRCNLCSYTTTRKIYFRLHLKESHRFKKEELDSSCPGYDDDREN